MVLSNVADVIEGPSKALEKVAISLTRPYGLVVELSAQKT
jgi:hypothetical protein